jgi:DNA-binding transcriptional ArsR family regulator
MDEQDTEALRRFFATLAHEERLAVAGTLATRASSIAELAELLRLRPETVGRHLAMLREIGIATSVRDGAIERWRLDIERLRAERKRLLARERAPSPADAEAAPEWERLVLRNFFDGERLKEIPVNLSKRLVVLAWLAERFEPGRRYPEREVNEIITRHHPDYAALRRELVDQRFMQREHGFYWRVDRATGRS